ncbi:MAG: hypothetical protein N2C14_30765 [Planctomycetales bacterium]
MNKSMANWMLLLAASAGPMLGSLGCAGKQGAGLASVNQQPTPYSQAASRNPAQHLQASSQSPVQYSRMAGQSPLTAQPASFTQAAPSGVAPRTAQSTAPLGRPLPSQVAQPASTTGFPSSYPNSILPASMRQPYGRPAGYYGGYGGSGSRGSSSHSCSFG